MNFRECAEILKNNDAFLLVTHKNPDGDTMGSASALCSALRRAGKTAYLYPNPGIIEKLRPFTEKFFAPADYAPGFTVSIDTATENMFASGFEGKVQLCVDHHPTNTLYAAASLVMGERSSCGEIVLELIKKLCGSVTAEEATLLYIALSTDTGCFQYSNTNADSFLAAAELLEYGADNALVNTVFFRKQSIARLKLEGMIYSNMSFHRGGTVCVATVTQDMMRLSGATEDDCDDLAGLAGRAEGACVNATIREKPDGSSKISVRSTPQVSSSDICAVFGGGGHKMAAGCTISCPPEKAKEMLLAVIDELLK